MNVVAITKDTETNGAKDTGKKSGSDLAGMFKRLPSEALKKIANLAQTELDGRDGKDVSGMSEAEFNKYMSAQFDKADKAAREADLRRQLMGKPNSKSASKDNADE